jgi:hypothetical protein
MGDKQGKKNTKKTLSVIPLSIAHCIVLTRICVSNSNRTSYRDGVQSRTDAYI